ncbi:MAG: hypothetical protein Q8S02_05755 [Hydrogenophaga sp.]|jgi:hypothetical protein|nr:hypothetical protein [Hydrogenophaga sp.]
MVLPILVPPIEWAWDVHAVVTPLGQRRGSAAAVVQRVARQPTRFTTLAGSFIPGDDVRRLPPYGSPVEHTTRDLLFDCEVLIKALLRRARRTIGPHVTAAIQRISHSFEPASGTVAICASDAAVVAWMMAAMRWQGMTHPQSLIVPTLHPPTAVVHWLAHFGVEQQLARGRAILDLLVMRFHMVAERCRKHIRAVMARARRAGRAGQTHGIVRCAL